MSWILVAVSLYLKLTGYCVLEAVHYSGSYSVVTSSSSYYNYTTALLYTSDRISIEICSRL